MDNPPLDDRYRVETPEQIGLEYDVAGLGSRFVAALIDMLILQVTIVLFFCVGFFGLSATLGSMSDTGFWLAIALIVLVIFFAFWGYYIFFETLWNGQSPGKRWTNLRVIQEGGYPIGFSHAAIRNLVRLVDFLPAYYIVGATVMLVDKRSRRLGDLLAGTIVVKEPRDVTLETLRPTVWLPTVTVPQAAGAAPSLSTVPNLHRLTGADQSLIAEYFNRRADLTPEAASQLSLRLATAISKKLEYTPAGDIPEQFLARVARELRGQQLSPPTQRY